MYYPSIEDDNLSCNSAEIEGGGACRGGLNSDNSCLDEPQADECSPIMPGAHAAEFPKRMSEKMHPWRAMASDDDEETDYPRIEEHGDKSPAPSPNASQINGGRTNQDRKDELVSNQHRLTAMIRKEKNRRLGIQQDQATSEVESVSGQSASAAQQAAPGGVLGNIRGWFAERNMATPSTKGRGPPAEQPPSVLTNDNHARSSDPSADSQSTSCDDSSDEESSSSSDEESTASQMSDHDLNPAERARVRALRYLSNSCVDAGRKAKTLSYIRGLERLDLKRKRDRYEKELEVVEDEMNKDRGVRGNVPVDDKLSALAAKLGRQLPRIQDGDADAGAGGVRIDGRNAHEGFMSYDEYLSTVGPNEEGRNIWDDVMAVDGYVLSLQNRLQSAVDRTRSLENRLNVIERAGDDIISSLCEDLAEVTRDSNRTEARYVKKGKQLQRKKRMKEAQNEAQIKHGERCIRKLEARLVLVSSDASAGDLSSFGSESESMSSADENEEDDDEVLLENKLSSIKAKDEQDKSDHDAEVASIRRQCDQLILRFKVARLVMEGDDNLRDYLRLGRKGFCSKCSSTSTVKNHEGPCEATEGSSSRTYLRTTTRNSKAFTDATINALEEELAEREDSSQKMEVRCLNELMVVDGEIKELAKEASCKIAALEVESTQLKEAIAACSAEKSIEGVNAMLMGETQDKECVQCESEPDTKALEDAQVTAEIENTTTERDRLGEAGVEDSREGFSARDPAYDHAIAIAPNTPGMAEYEEIITVPLKKATDEPSSEDGSEDNDEGESEGEVSPPKVPIIEDMKSDDDRELERQLSNSSSDEREKVVQLLGKELQCTLAEYQTSFDLSSSSDRVEQLNYMNAIVLKIARVKGIPMQSVENETHTQSWSMKNSEKREKRERRDKKRLKRHRRGKNRKKDSGHSRNESLLW
ncbi:hypothetical protein THAOC_05012 [Thalassiosira oceanica]|uniref:Uncharacterized protein n=1 Tax=Thalassiosira oceanica TaxID=159749 RepID=K0T3U5_THAOC|nr:hypothetical protein THAOC_05012 [Thalassiosira oceanica]|eukprot:EJK73363.1 hypothetical protein THAOC_05012 [Thalassiosira oceanica]